VLAPLAERREALGGFVRHAGETAAATAAAGDALEANLAKLPAFLRELEPAADRFGALASELTPAVRSLADQAPAVNAATRRLGPFAAAATPALQSLGDVADRGRRTFPRVEPLVDDLIALGKPLQPLASNLAALGTSFDEAGGIEELMRTIYFYTGSINGVDALGHYVRAGFGANQCVDRAYEPVQGCEATFDSSGETSALPASTTAVLDYLLGPDAEAGP
jgi:ABC-type transporter Mla subunit MlaD